MLRRVALWGPLIVAALLLGAYAWLHRPLAQDGTELLQVPLSGDDPTLTTIGDLTYLGGLDIPRMGQNIGGLSGLRWDAQSRRLLAITDDARWVWITPVEQDGKLVGIANTEVGSLLGLDGEPLTGKAEGDSESLSRFGVDGWAIGFERDHRVLEYSALGLTPSPTEANLAELFGPLEKNNGLETLVSGGSVDLLCVERAASRDSTNCIRVLDGQGPVEDFPVRPPAELADLGAVPTDGDARSNGTVFVLFRSYSPADGNGAAIVSYDLVGQRRELATFRPPLTVDNFEGLAVREEGDRTFLYIVSDDNFSGNQRTLLMKFEVLPDQQP